MTGVLLAVLGSTVGDKLTITDGNITDIGASPYTGTATLIFNTNGKQQKQEHVGAAVDMGDYVVPNGRATAYEVFVHKESGPALTSGTLDAWIACSTSPSWTTVSSGANKTILLTASLRLVGTTTTLITGTTGGIQLEVEAT